MARVTSANELPVHKLTKRDWVYLGTHYCRHGHTYLEHYSCYKNGPGAKGEHLGFLDIETSNLQADFGIILSYCIKDGASKKIYSGVITKEQIEAAVPGQEDKAVVEQLIRDMARFDRVVTYYGTKFDVPYIRTRAMVCGVDCPSYGVTLHTDLYYLMRNRFRLSSNRLENACRVILGKTDKTRVDSKYWRGGVRGDADSLKYILDHNKKDVLDLEKLYRRVIRFAAESRRSI